MNKPKSYRCNPPFWEEFQQEHVEHVFKKGGFILDIGGGLRLDSSKGNKFNKKNYEKFQKYLSDPSVDYKVSDYTDQYNPDYVEDVHQLSFEDNSVDGIFCIALLEHVYDPKRAAEEIMRVLKPGAEAFLYVPFMYRYHANSTEDYKDYFRYSKDGIAYLFRKCSQITLCPVRGLFESLLRFTPLHTMPLFARFARYIDWHSKKMRSISEKQASGYFIHIIK